jgi:hypothetical protein
VIKLSTTSAKKVREKNKKRIEISLFSTASPLFFKISAMVTTVAIAVHITTCIKFSNLSNNKKYDTKLLV